jgi:putative Mg2+ transporter-C (MgtC) family protein
MAAAVQDHDVIVRSAIERNGGHVFATGGDGFCAAFSSPVGSVTAAVESQRELGGDDTIPFAVRMALHTGETIQRSRNYYGTEVNRAARLMALAHGGQVLASDTADVLVRSRVGLRPLGDHLLRGLRGTIPVFQVMADGLPAEFPVLRSVDHFAANLPRQVSSFVGRDAEVDDVAELVRSQRLVTLTGVGGVGKTQRARLPGSGALRAVGVLIVRSPGIDPTRIAAYVVSGVGSLGAGVIFRDGVNVRGINTAATIWYSSAVGVLAGGGYLVETVLGTVLVVVAHVAVRPVAR